MNEEEKDSVEILNNTNLDINTIYSVDLHTYNYAVKTALNLIQKQQTEIEQLKNMNSHQDKIINKMALDIAANDSNLCQYIDETIRCKKYAGENKLTCDECIKQYYERKVENGN